MCHPALRRALIAAQRLRDLAQLRRVRDRMDREVARPLDLVALARLADMPSGQLSRQFRLAYGQSPYAYVTARRIEHAMALLRQGGTDAGQVWRAVGCPTAGVFGARFTALVGMSPDDYRRRAALDVPGPPWRVPPRAAVSSRIEEAPARPARIA
ncbi:helix-turn-helix transcriptional regulator [Streptomyces sp. NPDC088387]|uniref:helix-turn-helix transcriptional regulator n=1 Tax=Streptomyces sp. NPDC088387 TaxID=3365859 RepID=UPI003804BB5D